MIVPSKKRTPLTCPVQSSVCVTIDLVQLARPYRQSLSGSLVVVRLRLSVVVSSLGNDVNDGLRLNSIEIGDAVAQKIYARR